MQPLLQLIVAYAMELVGRFRRWLTFRRVLGIVVLLILLLCLRGLIEIGADLTFIFGLDLGLVAEVSALMIILSARQQVMTAAYVTKRWLLRIRPAGRLLRRAVKRAVRSPTETSHLPPPPKDRPAAWQSLFWRAEQFGLRPFALPSAASLVFIAAIVFTPGGPAMAQPATWVKRVDFIDLWNSDAPCPLGVSINITLATDIQANVGFGDSHRSIGYRRYYLKNTAPYVLALDDDKLRASFLIINDEDELEAWHAPTDKAPICVYSRED